MKNRKIIKLVIAASLLLLVGVLIYKTYPDNVFAVRIVFNLDRQSILSYQRYRINEFAKYHNYDTSYLATRDAFYNKQRKCE